MKISTLILACLLAIAWTTQGYAETVFDFGGQLRVRPEMRENSNFNSDIDDKQAFVGSRTRLFVNAKVDENVIAKLTIQDARRWGKTSNVGTGLESDALDLYEAFFQINNIGGTGISTKIGRQPLVYGDQRLLGHLGWTDFARTHDAAKVMAALGMVNIDLFAAKEAETGKPSNSKNDDDLIGAYAVANVAEGTTLDLYVINWKTSGENDEGARIQGRDIMTYGARVKAVMGSFDITGEAAFQSGDWTETVSHSANAFSVKAGYNPGMVISRVEVEYNRGSGDDGSDEHKAFVFPFHTNHLHYGHMDYFSWGNIDHWKLGLKAKPIEGALVKLDFHIFKLAEGKGDWLNVVGTKPFKAAVPGKSSTEAGNEIDLTVAYKALKNLKLVAGYSIFQPGEAAKERSGGKDDQSNWGYVMSVFNF